MKKKNVIIKQNIGVDMAKDDFQVVFSTFGEQFEKRIVGSRTFNNTFKGCNEFLQWANSKRNQGLNLHVTTEATGVYHELLCYYLCKHSDATIHVVLPNLSKKFGQSLGTKSKTDKIDAKILAQMGLERDLIEWRPINKDLLFLKQLTRERDSFICSKTAAINRLHASLHQGVPNKFAIGKITEHVTFLNKQISEIEQEIKLFVNSDENLKRKISYLTSIPGVGLITAVTIVAETGGFESFTSIKQLTSYVGLDVVVKESGKWKGKSKISKKGNGYIRKALFMPALSAKKYSATMSVFYKRIKERKGAKMVAVVAVQRKLLGLMYSLWKNEQMYVHQIEKI
jgi:transposase